MNTIKPSGIVWLKQSQLGADSWHSVLISLLRAVAAIQVTAAHLRADFFPGLRTLENPSLWYQALAFFSGFAHQAVLVFFLISGWLVGGSLLNRIGQPDAIKLYAIDRLTRLWTVQVPTFMLILAIGIMTGLLNPRSADFAIDNPYSVSAFIGNMVGLQTVLLPEFGGNFPLWSLANESWYYLMFPLLLVGGGRALPRQPWVALAALGALALLLPLNLILYFTIWLLGALFSRIRIDCGAASRAALLLALATLAVWFRLKGYNDEFTIASYGQDLLLSVMFMLFLSTTVMPFNTARPGLTSLRRYAVFFSNFSFTLYVVHIPVLALLAYLGVNLFGQRQLDPNQIGALGVYLGMLTFVLLFAYGFYLLFEARTPAIRQAIKKLLLDKGELPVRTVPAKH